MSEENVEIVRRSYGCSRHWATSLPATLLAAGLIAGCGGGHGNDTTTAALTKAQLVQRANAICRQVIQNDHHAKESLGQSPTVAQVRQYVLGAMARIQGEIDQIRAIGVPQGDGGQVKAFRDEAHGPSIASKLIPPNSQTRAPTRLARRIRLRTPTA